MMCSRCKKRPAVLFVQRIEDGKQINEGLCLVCAKEMGMPQISQMMDKMGITDEDIEDMTTQLMEFTEGDSFEPGGAETMPNFLQSLFGGGPPQPEPGKGKPGTAGKPADKKEKKEAAKHKFLDTYCTNLCLRARDGKLDRVIGREKEIYRVIQILSRRSKNNPCLIGEPGVGKTAIAEGIAQRIVAGNVPFRLLGKEIYLLDMTALVAGTQFRGQFESRVKGLIDEVKAAGNVILFIDEVHTLVGTGDSEGSMSAANIMKPALSRGEIQVIGATTFTEYRKNIEKDSALERRFQPVTVNEPSMEETLEVLRGVKEYYERHHKVKASDEILKLAVLWSERYINDRFLPDKAIDLLDEACACASLRSKELTDYAKQNARLKELTDEEKALEENSENAENPDFERIATIKADIIKVKDALRELEPKVTNVQVEVEDLARVIELCTGIPSAKIEQNDYKKLKTLAGEIRQKIIGQDEAVEAVAKAIRRSRMQLSKKKRPASFIFVGPTGVGKTELVKVLSNVLFDSVDPVIRFDMSEFMEKHAVARLIGSPPGYVGYDDAGQLTEKIRRRPYSVVLFDEIEKAHPDVMNVLLQILDEGHVTDAHGRDVSFENTVIVMTSNAGSNEKTGVIGFNLGEADMAKEKALKALSDFLRPEFLGRVDEVIVFKPLNRDSMDKISMLLLEELKESMLEKNITLCYNEEVAKKISELAGGGKYNARDIRKTIRKEVEDRITECLIDHYDQHITGISLSAGDGIEVSFV